MWTQIKIYVLLAAFVISNASGIYFTWRYMDNKHKAQQLEFQKALTRKDNEAKEKAAKHQREVELLREKTRTELARIPGLVDRGSVSCDTYIDDIDRMQHEIYTSFPDLYFQGTDNVSRPSEGD